jgi:hypothetical protein
MQKQQITPEESCAYVIRIPSGRGRRDACAFLLHANWHFQADGGGVQVLPARLANYAIRRKIEGVRVTQV